MPLEGEYEPSPWRGAARQVELYEATGGERGGTMGGKPVVILTTKGARTGKLRKTPLMRVADGDRYAVIASLGGAAHHPVWYHNVVANPIVTLQDGATVRDYRAHVAEGDERAEWWARAVEAWPDYANYQTKTRRVIPVVVLEPLTDSVS